MRISRSIEEDFANVSSCLETSIEYDFLCNRIWINKLMLRILGVGVILFVACYSLILLNINNISAIQHIADIFENKFDFVVMSFFIFVWLIALISTLLSRRSLKGREKVQVDNAKVIRAYVINQYERKSENGSGYYANLACRDDDRMLLGGREVTITRSEFQQADRGIEVIYNVYQYTLNSKKKMLSVSDTEFAKFVRRKYHIL